MPAWDDQYVSGNFSQASACGGFKIEGGANNAVAVLGDMLVVLGHGTELDSSTRL